MTFSIKYKRWIGLTVYPFFMLFTFLTASGQDEARAHLLNLEFEQTRQVTANSNAPLDLYYANLADILELILLENEKRFDALTSNESLRLNVIRSQDEDSPWTGFIEAEVKLQWAFVNFKYGNDWDAFWGLRSAYRTAQKNYSRFPQFMPNNRTLGILNIIFGNVPSKNQWLMKLFGLKGDVQTGLTQLAAIEKTHPEFRVESMLVLGMANVYLLEDFDEAIKLISDETIGTEPLIEYVKSLIYLKSHEASKAQKSLFNSSKKFPIHDYLIAETFFQAGEYSKAIAHYQDFLQAHKGTSYIKDAYLKLGVSQGFLGDTNAYEDNLAKSKSQGEVNSEIDKNAAKLIQEIQRQNPTALKIRFAIDGGYYQKADSLITLLETKVDLSDYERLELIYRKARMNHLVGKTKQASTYYRQVINNAELISETYYGPNSYLQLGYLMRKTGDSDSARMYFNRVLSFKKHPYKNSLDSKAKIALKQLDLKDE